jgi:UDP-N-acetylmuramoyl-tripeptide--D-alanyl-D-alanine ligase
VLHGEAFAASGVSIDTRTIKQGDLFIALVGDNTNGHQYLKQAHQAGAAGALVNFVPEDAPEGLPLMLVHHTQMALEDLGRAARKRSTAAIIGVTGSVGKTSAKEMLKLVLAPYGRVYATVGNYNNHLGLPISLANMPRDTEFGVFEMGMNHAGEIEFLSRLGEPHVGLITTVEAVHLEFFDSVEGIARAKSELFAGMAEGGPAILNADNPYFTMMSELAVAHDLEVVGFGEAPSAEFRVLNSTIDALGTVTEYSANGERRFFHLGSLGSHWPKLAVAVLAVVKALALPLDKAEDALAGFTEAEGRGKIARLPWKGGEITLIDDAYNASPVSMKGALEKLGMIDPEAKGRRVAVLGEMLELGAESARFHSDLLAPLKAHHIDRVMLAGAWMEYLNAALPKPLKAGYEPQARDLTDALFAEIQAGDVVLFKGSHGSKVYKLVEALKQQAGRDNQTHHVKVKNAL